MRPAVARAAAATIGSTVSALGRAVQKCVLVLHKTRFGSFAAQFTSGWGPTLAGFPLRPVYAPSGQLISLNDRVLVDGSPVEDRRGAPPHRHSRHRRCHDERCPRTPPSRHYWGRFCWAGCSPGAAAVWLLRCDCAGGVQPAWRACKHDAAALGNGARDWRGEPPFCLIVVAWQTGLRPMCCAIAVQAAHPASSAPIQHTSSGSFSAAPCRAVGCRRGFTGWETMPSPTQCFGMRWRRV